MSHVPPYLEKLVDLAQVYSLLGIQFVDVAAVSIHEVQAEAHHLEKRRAVVTLCTALWFKKNLHNVTYFEQHVFLAGSEVQLVVVVIGTQVHDIRQQLFISVDHLQLLLQRLAEGTQEFNIKIFTCQILLSQRVPKNMEKWPYIKDIWRYECCEECFTLFRPTWVILLWLARNMDKFWDSWMDEGSDIFLRNWAALSRGEKLCISFKDQTQPLYTRERREHIRQLHLKFPEINLCILHREETLMGVLQLKSSSLRFKRDGDFY